MKSPLTLLRFSRNGIRVKIIVSWLVFLCFCLLLWCSWRHRILWLALLVFMQALIQFSPPRLPRVPRLFRWFVRFGAILFISSVLIHAFNPYSLTFLVLAKIVSVLFVVPILCYKAHADYGTFSSAQDSDA